MGTHYRRRNSSWLPVSEEQSVMMGKARQSIFRGGRSLRRQLIHSGGLESWERIVGGAGLCPSRHCYMAWCLAGRPCFRGTTTSLNNVAVWGPNPDSNHTGALASQLDQGSGKTWQGAWQVREKQCLCCPQNEFFLPTSVFISLQYIVKY